MKNTLKILILSTIAITILAPIVLLESANASFRESQSKKIKPTKSK